MTLHKAIEALCGQMLAGPAVATDMADEQLRELVARWAKVFCFPDEVTVNKN
jgi:hypothetical protein